jgi:hypothetical protein
MKTIFEMPNMAGGIITADLEFPGKPKIDVPPAPSIEERRAWSAAHREMRQKAIENYTKTGSWGPSVSDPS